MKTMSVIKPLLKLVVDVHCWYSLWI